MRGFTLIELLAVIVILSIILLISVAVVSNVIDESKKKSYLSSTHGIISSAEMYHMDDKLKDNEKDIIFTYTDGIETANIANEKLSYTGKKPQNGKIFIYKNGDIAMSLYFEEYCTIKYRDSSEVTLEKMDETECSEYIAILNYPRPKIKTIPESDFDIKTNIVFSIEEMTVEGNYTVIDEEWENVKTNYETGEHIIRMRAKFSNDFWGPWGTLKINVSDLTPPVANFTMSPAQISNVTDVVFDDSSSISFNRTTIVDYEWENKLTNYTVGNHTVRLRVKDSNDLWSPWKEINFDVTQFVAETVTYDYISNAVRTYTIVQGGVYKLQIYGAQGGSGGRYCENSWGGACYNGALGVTGASATGEVRLAPGDNLYIYIGEQGKQGTNYSNETGSAGCWQYGYAGGGGGGGGTVVRLNTDNSLNRIIGANGGTGGLAQGTSSGCTYAAPGQGGYSGTDYLGVTGFRQTGGAGGGVNYVNSLLNPSTTSNGRTGHGRFILTRISE